MIIIIIVVVDVHDDDDDVKALNYRIQTDFDWDLKAINKEKWTEKKFDIVLFF